MKEKSSSDISLYTLVQCWCVNGKMVQQQQASRPANGGMHALSVWVWVWDREHQSLGVDIALLFTASTAHTRAGSPAVNLRLRHLPFAPFVYTFLREKLRYLSQKKKKKEKEAEIYSEDARASQRPGIELLQWSKISWRDVNFSPPALFSAWWFSH